WWRMTSDWPVPWDCPPKHSPVGNWASGWSSPARGTAVACVVPAGDPQFPRHSASVNAARGDDCGAYDGSLGIAHHPLWLNCGLSLRSRLIGGGGGDGLFSGAETTKLEARQTSCS